MDINKVNKYNTNSLVQTKNRPNLFKNEFEEKLNYIVNDFSKADEYIPSKELNESLQYVRYDNTKTFVNNAKPILKHIDKGIITLTDKFLFFTPYDGGKASWSKAINSKREYDEIYKKIEIDDFQQIENKEFWEEKLGAESESTEKLKSKTDSNIVVNADGSRVLIITMTIGGMETSMSIEISKPTELQNDTGSMVEKDAAQLQQNFEKVEGNSGN